MDASISATPTEHNNSDELEPVVILPNEYALLDPVSDAPMQLAVASTAELPQLAAKERRLRLRLTSAQKEMDGQQGTVLLLGRAGTGKTVCLCERMAEDRARAAEHGGLQQLFVARSARLRALVRGIQTRQCGDSALAATDFLTLEEFLALLQSLSGALLSHQYPERCRVDFERFKGMLPALYPSPVKRGTTRLDEHVLWTQIRSFIKGSLEAAMRQGRPLELHQYLALVPERCRFSEQQRWIAYAVFEKYDSTLIRYGLWDESGRVMYLLDHGLRHRLAGTHCSMTGCT